MVKKAYYRQNNGHLPATPPHYLGTLTSACWRRIMSFLEATGRIEQIGIGLVKQYYIECGLHLIAYQGVSKHMWITTRLSMISGI